MADDLTDQATRVADLMDKRGLNQRELGAASGLGETLLSKIRHGQTLTIRAATSLADPLQTTPSYLLFGEGTATVGGTGTEEDDSVYSRLGDERNGRAASELLVTITHDGAGFVLRRDGPGGGTEVRTPSAAELGRILTALLDGNGEQSPRT